MKHLYILPAIAFALPALAQNNTDEEEPNNDQCSRLILEYEAGNSTLNATGIESFRLPLEDDDWYISTSLEFRQSYATELVVYRNMVTRQNFFLSVPESYAGSVDANGMDMCFYRMQKQNATKTGDGHSCNGVLSQECIDALERAETTGTGCPRVNPDECDAVVGAWTSVPFNLSAGYCTDEMPGIDLPDGYVTQDIWFEGLILPPEDAFFEAYDLIVQQPQPILLTARWPDGRDAASLVCVVPEEIMEGSREPENSLPGEDENGDDSSDGDDEDDGENAAGSLSAWDAFICATAISCGFMLMLA